MPKTKMEGLPTVKEMKTYLGIDGRHNDALLADFLRSAIELTEKVLRYKISDIESLPVIIKEAVKYAVAYLYTNRETADFLVLEKTIAVIVSAHRKEGF